MGSCFSRFRVWVQILEVAKKFERIKRVFAGTPDALLLIEDLQRASFKMKKCHYENNPSCVLHKNRSSANRFYNVLFHNCSQNPSRLPWKEFKFVKLKKLH